MSVSLSGSPRSKLVQGYVGRTNLPSRIGGNAAQRLTSQFRPAPVASSANAKSRFGFAGPEIINSPQGRAIADVSQEASNAAIRAIGDEADYAAQSMFAVDAKRKADEAEAARQAELEALNATIAQQQADLNKEIAKTNKAAQDHYNSKKYDNAGVAMAPKMGKNGSASWISQNVGKYHDFDGQFGAQCVDLYNFYTTGFVGGNHNPGGRVNYAIDIWNNYDSNAYTRVSASSGPQMGDVVVYKPGGYFDATAGHVGIVAGVNKDGTLNILQANATSAGSKGNTIISRMSTQGTMGYLRPNKLMGGKN